LQLFKGLITLYLMLAQEGALSIGMPQMTKLMLLDELPSWAVISDAQALKLLGLSKDTLARLDKSGDGPPKVLLSPRRHGRPIGGLRAWLAKRTASPNTLISPGMIA
jgi:hypothetical protein